jgi:hypothetical protein
MGIEGTCSVCGGTTIDYGCLNCITAERDRLKEEVTRLERVILEKPDFQPPIPGEAIEKFQRLWQACIGLSEKADFKAIFHYAHRTELKFKACREALEKIRDVRAKGCSDGTAIIAAERFALEALQEIEKECL